MKGPKFFHYAAIFMLLAWAGVLLYFYASGRAGKLLVGNFEYGPLLAGLGLAVMGLFNLFTSKVTANCGHDHHHPQEEEGGGCCGHDHEHAHHHDHEHAHHHDHEHAHHHDDHDHDDHDHGHEETAMGHSHDDQTVSGVLVTLLIVLIPAVGATSLAQDKLSVETLASKGLFDNNIAPPSSPNNNQPGAPGAGQSNQDEDRYTLADLEKQVRRSPEGNFMIPIPSLYYSAADEELADVLQGQPVETTGQVVKEIEENDPEGTRLRLYRLFVSCCLADARPIGFSADFGEAPPTFAEDSWVKIIGKMRYPKKDGRPVPVIDVDTVEAIPEPEDAMY